LRASESSRRSVLLSSLFPPLSPVVIPSLVSEGTSAGFPTAQPDESAAGISIFEFPPLFTPGSSRSATDARRDPAPPLAASSGSVAALSSRAYVPRPYCALAPPRPTLSVAPPPDRRQAAQSARS